MTDINRVYLIFWMLGFIQGYLKDQKSNDALIILDEKLITMGQPPISEEEKSMFKDFNGEIEYACLAAGINREQCRKLGGRNKK